MLSLFKKKTIERLGAISLKGLAEVDLYRDPRAKRLILRQVKTTGGFRLTVPPRTPQRHIIAFLEQNKSWMAIRAKQTKQIPFEDGVDFLLWGRPVTIRHVSDNPRGLTSLENGVLKVHGDSAQLNARILRFIKKESHKRFEAKAHTIARRVNRRVSKVTLRDTTSRWGSCTRDGHISLSWRLALLPEWVADYVIAHEVAHLVHMDHSANFWALCEKLDPNTQKARSYLSGNGQNVYQYG